MEIERIKYKADSVVNYTITENLCTICANNPLNINNNRHLLSNMKKCLRANEKVNDCFEFKNYNDFIKK